MKRRMMGGKRYSYTIDSNCEGGSVYLDDVYKGSISDGRLVVEIVAGKESYKVRISGGVPSGGTDTWTDTDSEYTFYTNWGKTGNFPNEGGSGYRISPESWRKPMSRSASRPRYHGSPANATVMRDSSVTMNYTTSYGGTSYGSWSYGDRVRVGSYIRGVVPSWITFSEYENPDTPGTTMYEFSAADNGGGTHRSYSGCIRQYGNYNEIRFTINQAGESYVYTVHSNVEGAPVYFNGSYKGDISGDILDVTIEDGDSYYNVTMGSVPAIQSTSYTFNIQSTLAGKIPYSGMDGATLAEIISQRHVTTYTYATPDGKRVDRGGSVTINYGIFEDNTVTTNIGLTVAPDTGFLTGIGVTDHGVYKSITGSAPRNDTGSERSATLTYKQDESHFRKQHTFTQEVVSQTFTLYSDREGGEVTYSFNNGSEGSITGHGTISGGKFVYTHVGEFTGGGVAFIISGGTPPPYTRTGWGFGVFTSSDSSVAYLREVTVSALSWQDYPDLWIISSKDTYERSYDTDPLVGSCEPDGSLTLNATYEDTCVKREYMNAGWSIPAGVSWIGPTYDDGMTGVGIWGTQRRIRYSTTEANNGSSPRSCTITFTQRWLAPDSPMPDISITFTQKGGQPVVTQPFTVRNLTDSEGMLSIAKTGVEPVRGKKWKVGVRSQFGVASLDTLTDGTTWRSGDTLCMFFDGERVVNKKVYDDDIVDINNTSV